MTLTQALARARLYSGLVTTDIATTEMTTFVSDAEFQVACDLLETNPSLAILSVNATYTANQSSITCNTTFLSNLGASRALYKFVRVTERSLTTPVSWITIPAAEVQEMSGSGETTDLGEQTYSSLRWHSYGDAFALYPIPTVDINLNVVYTRVPVAQTTPASDILSDFNTIGKAFSLMVPLKAAQKALAAWDRPTERIDRLVAEYEANMRARLSSLQQQEERNIMGVRWFTDR